ncbi:hypothetical protein [Brucella rhizosphaerae]|uniref:Uncharacterized protein n=1 Tax=Brucella rhizosphaerae TaxID=571254 RepID=A0A256FIH5_9HYPH|nr:hypothetical protein [Brucella rhizosphaerae]OYR14476.1 hypothetical protein CEV32_0481 [Brucella rhizosphaerae]
MTDLLDKAITAFNALPPDQQRKMLEETRKSFAENNVAFLDTMNQNGKSRTRGQR